MGTPDTDLAKNIPDDQLEALVKVMFLAAMSDEEFSDVERKQFVSHVQQMTGGRLAEDAVQQFIARAESELDGSDRASQLRDAAARLPDPAARKLALSLAIRIAAADGIIRTSERELILEAAELLDIDTGEAADMVRELTAS